MPSNHNIPDNVIEDLRARAEAEGLELHVVPTDLGAIVLKTPGKPEFKRWQGSKAERDVSAERFVLDCALYPDEPTLRGWFGKRIAMAEMLTNRLVQWAAGATGEAEEKL
jgi:hypothetical protein